MNIFDIPVSIFVYDIINRYLSYTDTMSLSLSSKMFCYDICSKSSPNDICMKITHPIHLFFRFPFTTHTNIYTSIDEWIYDDNIRSKLENVRVLDISYLSNQSPFDITTQQWILFFINFKKITNLTIMGLKHVYIPFTFIHTYIPHLTILNSCK